MTANTQSYTNRLYKFSLGVFIGILCLFLLGLILLLFDFFALPNAKPNLAGTSYVLSFFLTGVCVLLLACKNTEFIYMLDACEQVIQITDLNEIPQNGKGISNYLSCLSSAANIDISTLGYQCYAEYNKGLNLVN